MSRLPRGRDHDRARSLAAERLDGVLAPADAAWLDAHLATCHACAATAAGYEADQDLLRGLRAHAAFEPPRDLWARTAAAIETEGGSRRRAPRRLFGLPAMTLAPLAGLAAVAIIVGSGLLNGQPVAPGGSPGPTPFAFNTGNVAMLNLDADGALQIKTGRLNEVCPITVAECRVEPSFDTSPITGIHPSQDVDAVISPTRAQIVVIPRGTGASGGVYVVPVKKPAPQKSPASSPTPTEAATEAPSTPPTEAPTESPVVATETPTDASGSPVLESPPASGGPTESPDTSASPEVTPEPTPDATPTPETTEAPTSTPVVAVTPRPDGAIEIARDVVVVDGPATYSPDGTRFAFTARPSDGSGGPDVYVWNTDEPVAKAITDDHRSVFAAWDGGDLLVSRVANDQPRTVRLDDTGKNLGDAVRGAWLPTLAPDRSHAVWWDGTVKLAEDGLTWVPGDGRLVTGPWPPADGGEVQAITNGRLDAWQVRWDPTGDALAVWVAGRGSDAGRLSLYAVDAATGRPKLGSPMLDSDPALGAFTLEPGLLAWSAPGKDSGKTVQVLAWKGDTIGRAELPADGDTTLIQ